MRNASSPGNSANTYSVNLISISPWIQQVTTPYNVPPTLHLQRNGGQVALTAFNAPISQDAGQWIAQKSTNLVDWADTVEPFVWNKCVISTSQSHEFYKLRWVPVSPAVQAGKAAQARQAEASLPKASPMAWPPANNLLLPPPQ